MKNTAQGLQTASFALKYDIVSFLSSVTVVITSCLVLFKNNAKEIEFHEKNNCMFSIYTAQMNWFAAGGNESARFKFLIKI